MADPDIWTKGLEVSKGAVRCIPASLLQRQRNSENDNDGEDEESGDDERMLSPITSKRSPNTDKKPPLRQSLQKMYKEMKEYTSTSSTVSDSDDSRESQDSSSSKPKRSSIISKLLQDLAISPMLRPQKNRSANIEPLSLGGPPPKGKVKDRTPIGKYKKTCMSINEPNTKLCEKYGACLPKIIGKGATSCVRILIAESSSGRILYAVKEFRKRKKNEATKEYMKKMTSEFCISSSLHHEHVVETVDLVVDEQHQWCEVMEYCPGGTLWDLLKENQLESQDVNCCFKQLIEGVEYIHSMGVAHRDLKPGILVLTAENILFDCNGKLKISDFGASDVVRCPGMSIPHLSKGVCGSMPYIAPEEFEGCEYDGQEVDIWAIGVIYYAMTYLGLPWYSLLIQASRNGQRPKLPAIPLVSQRPIPRY